MSMTPTKPYLIRAIHEWCSDQGFTPYLAVSVDAQTRVPGEFVRDGEIVLNVGNDATGKLLLGNDEISFQARFNGKVFPVCVPVERVMAIYARENGQGMAFDVIGETDARPAGDAMHAVTPTTEASESPEPTPARVTYLKRIK